MKKNPVATAHAAAITTALIYIVCAGAFVVAPDAAMNVARTWFHGIELSQLNSPVTADSFITGIMTATGGMWLVGYIFARIYNAFVKK